MSAYTDLMNRRIQGASNNIGQWVVNINRDPIDFDSMNRKDKEMYQEAAYFIQQLMAGLPTKASQEEKKEEDKSKLPLFDNAYFVREFGNHISNNMFGGREIDTQTDWNSLDERDSTTGLRGRTNRAKTLSNMLQSYSYSLEEGKHNFEGSPFKDLTDFKTKVNDAILALNTINESDDIPALSAIGLKASDWFNNGSGDSSGKVDSNRNPLTYAQLAEYNQQVEKAKLEELLIKQKAALKAAYDNTFFFYKRQF